MPQQTDFNLPECGRASSAVLPLKLPVSFCTAAEARKSIIGSGLRTLSFGAVALNQKPPRGASGGFRTENNYRHQTLKGSLKFLGRIHPSKAASGCAEKGVRRLFRHLPRDFLCQYRGKRLIDGCAWAGIKTLHSALTPFDASGEDDSICHHTEPPISGQSSFQRFDVSLQRGQRLDVSP